MIEASFNFLPARPAQEIVAEYIQTVDSLYEPAKYLARTYRHILAMRPTRAATAGKGQSRSPVNQNGRASLWSQPQSTGQPAQTRLATGSRGRLSGPILAPIGGDLPAEPQPHTQIPGKMRDGENLFKIRADLLAASRHRHTEKD